MTTLGDLVASVHTSLHSYTGLQEISTWLTADIDAAVTTLAVASSDTILKGIAEVDDELLYVNISDANGLTLAPFGRGYRGSTAAAHVTNAQITFDPSFPRVEIKRAIDQCVAGLFPQLYQVKSTDITFNPSALGYDLPADVENVIEVKAKAVSPLNYWETLFNWSFDPTSPEATGKALNLIDYVLPSTQVRVVYQAKFGTFAASTDTLASVGLSESYADLILYGVTARMIRFLDPGRLQLGGVENISRAGVVQSGDAAKIANQLYAMYQQRVTEERSKLLSLTPPTLHFTR